MQSLLKRVLRDCRVSSFLPCGDYTTRPAACVGRGGATVLQSGVERRQALDLQRRAGRLGDGFAKRHSGEMGWPAGVGFASRGGCFRAGLSGGWALGYAAALPGGGVGCRETFRESGTEKNWRKRVTSCRHCRGFNVGKMLPAPRFNSPYWSQPR
jgi:hypothetical protein